MPGETPLVETSHATLGITIDQQKVVELPLNGRNFTQLGTLIPGVVAPPAAWAARPATRRRAGSAPPPRGFNVNGMRNQSNNFLLDGASNNDTFNTGFVMRPPPDAIQEFKIQTHSYSAEFGRNAGSVVNVVTRGGTNQIHGAAWEFNRDDALQARNFFAPATQAKPKLKQNQFGGSLGGPILKNRFFGFGYYEGYRNTRGNTTQRRGAVGRAARRQFRGRRGDPGSADRCRVPRQRDSRRSASARSRCKLLDEFVPPRQHRLPQPLHRVAGNRRTTATSFGIARRLPDQPEARRARALHADAGPTPRRRRSPPRSATPPRRR